ncbi:MAG: hypothetical protein K9N10_04240 [Deltaproteobacteria bacterium]|nr:hypothetical protein [Deltaproteobacteria bacterium]
MSDLNPKEGEKGKAKPVDQSVGLDIESALSFIDSEEYQEIPPQTPATNPSAPVRHTVKPVQLEGSYMEKSADEKAPRPRKIEEGSVKKPITPQNGVQGKTTANKWLLWVGIAVLMVLAVFFLYRSV